MIIDSGKFLYLDNLGRKGVCRAEIFSTDKLFVVFTELTENTGPSITNCIENIIPQFCDFKRLNQQEVIFIEKYEDHPDDLDEIKIINGKPQWRRLEIEEKIGIYKL